VFDGVFVGVVLGVGVIAGKQLELSVHIFPVSITIIPSMRVVSPKNPYLNVGVLNADEHM
jgi:hypothetical protein